MIEFKELLALWNAQEKTLGPPPEPIQLWSAGGCGIWLAETLGPAVPYPPVDRRDGTLNHGYVWLKGRPGAAARVPEAQDWPELQGFLEIVNAEQSPIESVGCEKAYSAVGVEGAPPLRLGSYIDIIFTEARLNDRPENLLLLASRLAQGVEGCEKWWGDDSFVLQRLKVLAGAREPWGLMLQIKNLGRSEDEARKFWGESITRLGKVVASLPREFRYDG